MCKSCDISNLGHLGHFSHFRTLKTSQDILRCVSLFLEHFRTLRTFQDTLASGSSFEMCGHTDQMHNPIKQTASSRWQWPSFPAAGVTTGFACQKPGQQTCFLFPLICYAKCSAVKLSNLMGQAVPQFFQSQAKCCHSHGHQDQQANTNERSRGLCQTSGLLRRRKRTTLGVTVFMYTYDGNFSS